MKKVFFVGICGVSMSALAVMMKEKGYTVFGCDKNYSNKPKLLEIHNINVVPEDDCKIIEEFDTIVFSSAIKKNHPVYLYTKNKKCLTRGQLLGLISNDYEKVIAVAGSHGKSTTTAMIYHILKIAGKNPTLHLGALLSNEGTNVVIGGNEFFICEACEYYDNFLNLSPYLSVITNLEKEHLDYFKTFENEKRSFEKFQKQSKHVLTKTNYHAKKIRINRRGGVTFSLCKDEKEIQKIELKIGGFYNVKNAIFAYEACQKLGVSSSIISLSLKTFSGIEKRLDRRKLCDKNIIIDYAHHPTEIKNAYEYLRKIPQKINVVFQPHTFSRTRDLLNEFTMVLSKIDNLILYKTFDAREKEEEGISAKKLTEILKKKKTDVRYFEEIQDVENLISNQKEDEITVLMGAGDLPEKLKIY